MSDAPRDDYAIRLEVFEGPLDLLLYLIRRDEIDIYDIPIESVTRQYNDYLGLMKLLDLDIAGEFLVMSATLMMIKSRLLLPVEERPELEEDEEDPRMDLVRQLLEYKKFKEAADHLDLLEAAQQNVFTREDEHLELGKDASLGLRDVGIFDLLAAFNQALERLQERPTQEIFTDQYTVAQQIEVVMARLTTEKKFSLTNAFKAMKHREELICTFLALLELTRLKQVRFTQEESLREILVEPNDEDEFDADDDAEPDTYD